MESFHTFQIINGIIPNYFSTYLSTITKQPTTHGKSRTENLGVDKKGKSSREKWCAIKTVALPYWREVLGETLSGQYLFARNLVPGDTAIGADRISKKWKRLVKDELGIEADFYSLKHSNADDIAQLYGLAAAQGFIGHTSEKVTRIYATGQGERDLDAMKRIDNKFSEE